MLSDSENSPGQINILNIKSRLMKAIMPSKYTDEIGNSS